ncbi:hypothetical protein BJV78DRAFT_1254830 [Lactifluus subvellereus]|nr:hypothetical protein BJV78DRAFT_1254830 [Lactifluus subvellereus]
MGHSLICRGNCNDGGTSFCAQTVISGIIASVRERDDRWIALAMDQLRVSEGVLRNYLAHGDSVLLANLIYITRQIFRSLFDANRELAYASSYIVPLVSKFDIRNTLPELQHDFCALWNEIVRTVRKGKSHSSRVYILRNIRHLYVALHQDTEATPTAFSASAHNSHGILRQRTSYPLCNLPSHCQDSTSRIQEDIIGATSTAHAPATIPPTILSPGATLATVAPSTRPDDMLPSSSASSPGISRPLPGPDPPQCFTQVTTSSQATAPPLESHRLPTASPDVTTAGATQGTDISVIWSAANTIPYSTSSHGTTPQHDEETLTSSPSIVPDVPPSHFLKPFPSSALAVSDALLADLPSSLDFAETRSEYIPYALVSLSPSPTTTCLHITPQAPSIFDSDIVASISTLDAHDRARDLNVQAALEVSRNPRWSAPSVPDVDASAFQPEDCNPLVNPGSFHIRQDLQGLNLPPLLPVVHPHQLTPSATEIVGSPSPLSWDARPPPPDPNQLGSLVDPQEPIPTRNHKLH